MSRAPGVSQLISPAIFGIFIASLAIPAAAQPQSGRFLLTPCRDAVLECNLNASNCFNVTGAVQAAGDPGGDDQVLIHLQRLSHLLTHTDDFHQWEERT